MTIEEKAKRYDEAIEIAKEINNEQCAQSFNIMTKVFPELAESKDDKIRKIISDILLIDSDEIREILDTNNVLMQDIDDWLEKQGKLPHWKKSTLPNDNGTGFNSDYFSYNGYHINYKELFNKLQKDNSDFEKQDEQKSTDKVEPKFYEGDLVVLSTSNGGKVGQIDSIEYSKSYKPKYITVRLRS